ncbi:MAG TPA: dihydrolipoamide acetyltransferase family protein [Symbiobacteriaceae bacterium]|nr:dihydrolipoamide acetyltransferase family protein [Symbiobacteriaceae bacterium]
MASVVAMPKLGMSMAAGTILHWLKAEGDEVTRGEAIAEFESEKTTATLEAPETGRMGRILVQPGQEVPVGTPLCEIVTPGESAEVIQGARLTPAARQFVRDLGLELAEVAAAFPGGRVTREQVEAWAEQRAGHSEAAVAVAPPAPPAPPAATAEGERRPLSGMRAAVARRMAESLRDSAQLTLTATVDVTALVQYRAALVPEFEQEYGLRPSYTDFLVMAMARAVAAAPQVNARWEGDAITVLRHVHAGVAVALEDGLVVPVIRHCESLSLGAISRSLRDLAERARKGQLAPHEMTGSTITLTNLGPDGIDAFTPVLNPPEAAILGAGQIREVPAFVGGQLVPRSVMTLSLTIDHRVVDGAPGARYLRRVAELLGKPALLVSG